MKTDYSLELINITKKFDNQNVVENLNLSILPGKVTCLLGPSGCGKSTTLRIAAGLEIQDSGIIKITNSNDQLITKDMIGYIPENVNLYPYLSGIENLDYFCRLSGLIFKSSELEDLLNECGLESDSHYKRTSEYSKGMRQKVGIAIALAKNANIYLLDEPASGLDPMASNELSVILKKLSSKGSTILMASHDLFRVRETCDKIGILKQGCLIKEMLSKEVTSNELENIYLNFMQS